MAAGLAGCRRHIQLGARSPASGTPLKQSAFQPVGFETLTRMAEYRCGDHSALTMRCVHIHWNLGVTRSLKLSPATQRRELISSSCICYLVVSVTTQTS